MHYFLSYYRRKIDFLSMIKFTKPKIFLVIILEIDYGQTPKYTFPILSVKRGINHLAVINDVKLQILQNMDLL